MKKLLHIITLPLALAGISLMAGCEENIDPYTLEGSDQPLVYVNTMTPENIITANNVPGVLKQFVAVYPPTSAQNRLYFKLPAFITKSAGADVEVSFQLDKELFESYNALSTATSNAKILPEGIEVSLGSGKVTIPTGQTVSRDSVEMTVIIPTSATIPDGLYVIPVKIASVSGGAQVASSQNTIYMPFYFYASNTIDNRTTAPSGTARTTYTGWSVSSTPALTNPTNMLNTNSNTTTLSTPQELAFVVDMVSDRSNVTGALFRMNAASNLWSTLEVSTSLDNSTWEYQGTLTLGTYSTTYQPVAFRQAIPSVRYMKFVVKSWPVATTSFAIRQFTPYW